MFCNKCGNQLTIGTAFCPKCGTQSQSAEGSQQTTPNANDTAKPGGLWSLIVMLSNTGGLGFIGVAVYAFISSLFGLSINREIVAIGLIIGGLGVVIRVIDKVIGVGKKVIDK